VVATGLAVLLVSLLPLRARAFLAAGYLVVLSAFLAWCGTRDAGRVGAYQRLIVRNQGAEARRSVDFRAALLRHELEYLQKSGRTAEAAETENEIRSLAPEGQ
jgi:hypothetical protein